jgi:hypothetical protein
MFYIIAILAAIFAMPAKADETSKQQHVSFKALAENSKITQQQNIEIGDVPNHVVRIFEAHRTYPNDPPVVNGLSIVEEWDRGTADYIDGNGPVTVQYTVYVMENGDRFFARLAEVVQATAVGDVTATYVGHITGGTGRLVGIQGIVRGASHINFKTGFNENQTEIEYSVDNIKK